MTAITNKGNKQPDKSALEKLDSLTIPEDEGDVLQVPGTPAPAQPTSDKGAQRDQNDPELSDDQEPQEDPLDTPESQEDAPTEDPSTDYRRKFAESSRESQILASKNKKLIETIEQASQLDEVSEIELKAKYPEWDTLTDFEKKMAREAVLSSKRFNLINQGVVDTKKVDEWASVVDSFVDTATNLQKYPNIDGREAEFRSFCMKENRRGLDMNELAEWFSAISDSPKRPVRSGSLLGRPGGATSHQQSPQQMSLDQLRAIRTKNPRLYKTLVQNGTAKKVVQASL